MRQPLCKLFGKTFACLIVSDKDKFSNLLTDRLNNYFFYMHFNSWLIQVCTTVFEVHSRRHKKKRFLLINLRAVQKERINFGLNELKNIITSGTIRRCFPNGDFLCILASAFEKFLGNHLFDVCHNKRLLRISKKNSCLDLY